MITAIRSIGEVTGWEVFLFGFALCIILPILIFLLIKPKEKPAIAQFLLVQLIILEFCDTIWTFYFFPHGEYINRGIISLYVILLLPMLCFLSTAVCTISDMRRNKD